MHQTSLLYGTKAAPPPLARPARHSNNDEALARRLQEEENNRARRGQGRDNSGIQAAGGNYGTVQNVNQNVNNQSVNVSVGQGQDGGYVPDYCCMSWFVFLFCCWPIGIASICASSNVQSALARGDTNAARAHSSGALCLNYWARKIVAYCRAISWDTERTVIHRP